MDPGVPETPASSIDGIMTADELFTRVYDELRELAAAKLAREKRGHSIQATALVNEVYLRLQQAPDAHQWQNRRHFFSAAAEAMRRILVDNARRKKVRNQDLADRAESADATTTEELDDVLDIHAGLEKLTAHDPDTAELVKLHYFGGMSIDEAAELLGINRRKAFRQWSYARAWLYQKLSADRIEKKSAQ